MYIYEGKDIFLQLPTSFGYEVLSSVWFIVSCVQGGVATAFCLKVSALVPLTIVKLISLSECCFVAAILSAVYMYVYHLRMSCQVT